MRILLPGNCVFALMPASPLDGYEASMVSENVNITEVWRCEMFGQTYFVIYKGESRYSITECSCSGIRQAFISMGTVIGDENVLKNLSKVKQEQETIENYVENNAGCLIYG